MRATLVAAGWGVVEGSRIRLEYPISPGRLEGHGKRGRPLSADYVLEYRNTKLAVVEAKAWDEEITEGVAQAKNYAGKLAIRYTYATNGRGIYAIDMETGKEGPIAAYPTPDELWALTFAEADEWRDRFAAVPFEDKGGSHPSRYYQDIAVERVMQAEGLSPKENRDVPPLDYGLVYRVKHERPSLTILVNGGIETLELRLARMCSSAAVIAVASSGRLVPSATMVRPMTVSVTPK